MVRRNARRSVTVDNREGNRGEAKAGSGIHNLETAAARVLSSPSGLRSQGNQSRADMLGCLGARSWADRPGIPHRRGIDRVGDWGTLGILDHHGIHSSGDQRNREHRNNLGIHTPVMGRADIHRPDNRKEDRRNLDIHRPDNCKEDKRNPDIRRRGNRNKCRAAMVLAREPGRPREPEHSVRTAISASSHRLDKGCAAFQEAALRRLVAASLEGKRCGADMAGCHEREISSALSRPHLLSLNPALWVRESRRACSGKSRKLPCQARTRRFR